MIHSLRWRLLAMVAAVLAIALGTVGLLASRAFVVEFRQYLKARPGHEEPLAPLAARLSRDWSRARAVLAEEAMRRGRSLIVADLAGRVLAASGPEGRYASARFEVATKRLEVQVRQGNELQEMVLVNPGRVAVAGPDGAPLGMLFALPPAPGPREGLPVRSVALIGKVNRLLLLAALAGGVVGLALTAAVARRILRPVEELTAAARRMEAGDLSQRVAVRGRDEVGALARAFNDMANRRATAERLRRDLVSDVAHELRSPLTNIRCQLEALQDGLLPFDAGSVDSLHEETLLLSHLIDDLQDLALAEAGQLRLERGPLAPGEEIARAVAAVRPRAEERGVRLEMDLAADLPAVEADARRVGQILRNLLDNAVTHTPEGGRVRVAASQRDGEVRVTVEDTGPGVPPEHLPFLFERFYRTDASRTRATGGAGLGLAIVKQLAEAHGGRAWVESEVGRGAVFGFSLPAPRELTSSPIT